MDSNIETIEVLGEALAIGLLLGVERYKDRDPGEKKTAGMRTFTIFALLGAVCGLLPLSYTLITVGALILLLGLGYYRHSEESLGITTETAALLTFWLGYMMHEYETLAISVGIVLAILLASKRALHDFVKEEVSETELYDTLKFLAVVFVVFPLLPNQNIGPYAFFNPTHIWILIILVSTISYVGYVLIRVLGGKRGLAISALIGGIISTTAVTMSLAQRAKQAPEFSRTYGMAGMMANAVQFPRLLFLIWFVDRNLGAYLTVPLLGMGAVGLLSAWIIGRAQKEGAKDFSTKFIVQNPYSLTPALKFGLFFIGVFLLSKLATVHFGTQGIYMTSAIAGLGDASAISLSVAKLVNDGSLSFPSACTAIFIAVFMNALLKWILAWTNGSRNLAIWLGIGFAAVIGTGLVLLAVMHTFFDALVT